jgi:TolB-like protein/Tfp pilus assembly protein PilF
VRAKTFGVLCHFARHPGRVIGKEELFDTLWPGVAVTEETLTQSIRELRLVLGPAGAACLRTVPRRGYVLDVSPCDTAMTVSARPPVIVILPFSLVSADAADRALIDGLIEEITHATARYGQVAVIARHSAFQFRPDTTSPLEAARRLDTDYFVEGSVRRIGPVLRLSAALCQTLTGRQFWAETFELSADAFGEVPSIIAHRIVSRMTLDVERDILQRLGPVNLGDLQAYQHFATAVALLRQYGDGVNEAARDHLDKALRADPGFALAYAYRGLAELIINHYGAASAEALDRALAYAQEGLTLAPEEARCHWVISEIALCRRQHATAELHLRRALELNRSDPDLMAMMGYLLTMRGKPDDGIVWFRRAIALNPLHPAWYHNDLGLALQAGARFDEAIAHLLMTPRADPWWHSRIAGCYAALGDLASAALHMKQAYDIDPEWDALTEFSCGLEFEHAEYLQSILQNMALAIAASGPGGRQDCDPAP